MSDSEEGPIPESQYDNLMGNGVGEDFIEAGIIQSIELTNFMCHAHLKFELSPNINFLVGANGSGKSAVLVGLVTGLGATARFSNRGSKIGDLVKDKCHQAIIRITLKNEGPEAYNPEVYGPTITIERRILREGGGGYALKDSHGRKVSSTRDELDRILEQFNLQVDNPCTVLMQEVSKMFLTSNKPEKKYELFLQATQLEQMKVDLEETGRNLKLSENTVASKEEALVDMEDRLKVLEGKVQLLQLLQTHRAQVKELRSQLAWSHVNEREEELRVIETDMATTEEKYAKLIESRAGKEEALVKMRRDQLELDRELDSLKTEAYALTSESRQLQEQEAAIKREAMQYEANIESAKSEQIRLQKRRDMQSARIEEMLAGKTGKLAEYRKNLEKAKQKRAQVEKLQAELQDQEQGLPELKQEVEADENALGTQQHQMEALTADVDKYQLEVDRFSKAGKDRTAAFGVSAIDVVKIISQHANKFHHRPIGPLGMSITVKDPKWHTAVDVLMGKTMDKFAVNDFEDLKLLQSLTSKLPKPPQIIVTPFTAKKYELSASQLPPKKYRSLLSIIDINDPVCFNAVIDDASPERSLVFETYQEAKTTMFEEYGPTGPPHVTEALALDQLMLFEIRFGTQVTRGLKAPATSRFQIDITAALENAKSRYHTASTKLAPVRADVSKIKTRLDRNKKAVQHRQARINSIPNDIEKLQSDIEELEKAPEATGEHQQEVENLRATIPDIDAQLLVAVDGVKKATNDKLEFLKKLEPIAAQKRASAEQLTAADEKLAAASKELDQLMIAIQQAAQRLPRFDEAIQKVTAERATHTENHERQSKLVEESCVKAQFFSKRPSEPVTTPPDVLSRQIEQMEEIIAQRQKEEELDQAVVEEYQKAKQAIAELESTIAQTRANIELATEMLAIRARTWIKFRNSISMRTKMLFVSYLSYRNFVGDLQFDHKEKTLSITINPNRADTSSKSRDTTTLSGGERSFSTVALLLALWEAMESPFRAMDEFDVFMDAVNRRVAMEVLVEAASEKKHRQHIFLTPQQLQGVTLSKDVKVFRMVPPERNQRTITSMLGADHDQGEE